MFIKVTLQDTGLELRLNFDNVEYFYDRSQTMEDHDSWTTVRMVDGEYREVSESAEWILAQLAGGRG